MRVTSETRGAMVYLDEAFMGSTPVRRDGIEPGAHQLRVEKEGHVGWAKEIEVPAGAMMEVKVPLAALAERRHWPGPTAAALAVLAGLSGVVGIVLDALALGVDDGGDARGRALQDANVRFKESIAGDVFLGAAAGLALTAAVIVIAFRQDIFGATREERPSQKMRVSVRPYGLAGLEVRW